MEGVSGSIASWGPEQVYTSNCRPRSAKHYLQSNTIMGTEQERRRPMSKILLTEDSEDQRALYHEVLTEAGCEVIDAKNATEALALFASSKPDIVVLDIQMPGMDGIEAMSKILAKDRQIPVIFYSAYPAYQ